MKDNKGITLISLIITIVVLIILASTITYSGFYVYKNMTVENFISEMKLIQEKVNLVCEKFELSEYDEINSYLNEKGILTDENSIINIENEETKEKVNNVLNEVYAEDEEKKDINNYQYFNSNFLEKNLGIKNLEQEVIINFETREVISLIGVEKDDKMYYRQYDLPGGEQIVEYTGNKNSNIKFNVEKKIYGLSAELDIEIPNNIISDIKGVYYNEKDENNDPTKITTWSEIVSTSSAYKVDITKSADYYIKVEDKYGNNEIKSINVTLVNPPDVSKELIPIKYDNKTNKWFIVSENDGTWYDYDSTGTSMWANAMLSNGRYQNINGSYVDTSDNNRIIDLKEEKIELESDDMGSMFVWIPRYMYEIEQAKDEGGTINTGSGYNKSESGIINIKFLKGTTDIPTDNTTIKPTEIAGNGNWIVHPAFKDGTVNNFENGEWNKEITGIWVSKNEASSSIAVEDIYNNSKNINENVNSHLMKNSEYGAVIYLAYSNYGINILNEENKYGIYELNSGLSEVVALFNNVSLENILKETDNVIRNTKYITMYKNPKIYGNALEETTDTSKNECWESSDTVRLPTNDMPYLVRGSSKGLFHYESISGTSSESIGFRCVLINK